jgi:ribosomal protein L24E
MTKEHETSPRCAVCDQEVEPSEALYPAEVQEHAAHFCSPKCREMHARNEAPSKQEMEERKTS